MPTDAGTRCRLSSDETHGTQELRPLGERHHQDSSKIRRQILPHKRSVIINQQQHSNKYFYFYLLYELNEINDKFLTITELNLSHNQMSKLPEELAELQALERLDISHNAFIALPTVTCRIPQLKRLLANNNSIIGNLFI